MPRPDMQVILVDPVWIRRVVRSRHVQFDICVRDERLLEVHPVHRQTASGPSSDHHRPLDAHHLCPHFRPAAVTTDHQIELCAMFLLFLFFPSNRLVSSFFTWFDRVGRCLAIRSAGFEVYPGEFAVELESNVGR